MWPSWRTFSIRQYGSGQSVEQKGLTELFFYASSTYDEIHPQGDGVSIIWPFLAACGGDHYEANMTYQWSADRRSYKATADNRGALVRWFVIISVAPAEPMDKPIDRDWKTQNTDFYHYQLVNLVDEPIELRALHFRSKQEEEAKYMTPRASMPLKLSLRFRYPSPSAWNVIIRGFLVKPMRIRCIRFMKLTSEAKC